MSKTLKLSKESLSVLDELTDEQAGRLFKAIRDFYCGKDIMLDGEIKIAFASFRNQIINQTEKSVKRSEINRVNGLKGATAKGLKANASKLQQIAANCSKSQQIAANCLTEEKSELTDTQVINDDTVVLCSENVSETDCDFTTEIQPEKPKKVKKSKNPFTESEIWFLDLFNSLKAQLRDNPRPHKSISETGRRNLQKLLDTGHLQHDFEHAITAMLGADWAKRTGNDTPDHLLREENFLRYLNVQSLKQVQYGSDKPNREEEWADAYDTLKQFYTTEQPSGN